MKFSELDFQPHTSFPDTGIVARYFFPNGYGVSVVRFTTPFGSGSYGSTKGLYELAVLKGVEENWQICYDTPITEDVLGHLTELDVENLLGEVESLPDAL